MEPNEEDTQMHPVIIIIACKNCEAEVSSEYSLFFPGYVIAFKIQTNPRKHNIDLYTMKGVTIFNFTNPNIY